MLLYDNYFGALIPSRELEKLVRDASPTSINT